MFANTLLVMIEEFLRLVQENKILPAILQTVEPIILFHIQDNTNYTQLSHENRRPKPDHEVDTLKGLHVKTFTENPDHTPDDLVEMDGMHKRIALVYYAICWLFELFKKGKFNLFSLLVF